MDLIKYGLLNDIYNKIEIENIEKKNSEFFKIINILSENSDISIDDIKIYKTILLLINDNIFISIKRLISEDEHIFTSIQILRQYLSVKYDEKICFDIIDIFLDIIGFYNPNVKFINGDIINDYIIDEKSKSTDIVIATEGKMKFIKKARRNKTRTFEVDDDDLPF